MPIPTDTVKFDGTVLANFQLVTDDCVRAVLQERPKRLVGSTQY